MEDAVIVSAVRTAVGKAPGGTLRGTRPDELAAAAIGEALKRAPGIDASEIDDVILGCAMPEAEQGMNVARIASLRAGIPVSASAVTAEQMAVTGEAANQLNSAAALQFVPSSPLPAPVATTPVNALRVARFHA